MSRRRRWLLATVAALLLLGAAGTVAAPLLVGDGTDYGPIVSIEQGRSYQDPSLLARAWALPVARLYGPEGIELQRNPSFCGPASIANLARTLDRRLDQSAVLDGSGHRTVLGFLPAGLTLDEEAELARAVTGRTVTVLRDLSLADFRAEVARANDPSRRLLVNFTRKPLFGRGGGHHSPIGGYLADEDLALVVDVNPQFRPWLVPLPRLWEATRAVDRSSGKPRGLLRIE